MLLCFRQSFRLNVRNTFTFRVCEISSSLILTSIKLCINGVNLRGHVCDLLVEISLTEVWPFEFSHT